MDREQLDARIAEATGVFEKDVGVWDADVEVRPAPGATVIRQKGVATNRRIAGGRWLVMDYRADSGFDGHGVFGWDASTEKYTSAWVDSMQASIARGVGTWDPRTRTMTFETEATHGGRTIRYREITETRPDGSQVYRNLVPTPDGGEFEMIRMVYTKRT